jgi:hypothetical protein
MHPLKRFRPSPALIVAIAALMVALGGVAYATIPDSSGVIHGCYLDKIGTLCVIDPSTGAHCSTTVEMPISWNQSGPQGLKGDSGPPGAVIVARIRGQATLPAVNSPQTFDIPLTGNTWTQAANEDDFVTGRADVSSFPCGPQSVGDRLRIFLDGNEQKFIYGANASSPAASLLSTPFVVGSLFGTSGPTTRTLTVHANYSCSNLPTTVTISIDVLGTN